MDPFLSDRHARWHPVDLSLFPLRPSPCVPPVTHYLTWTASPGVAAGPFLTLPDWQSWFCQCLGIAPPAMAPYVDQICPCHRQRLDTDHLHTCSKHSGKWYGAHELVLSAVADIAHAAGFRTNRGSRVPTSRGQRRGDLERKFKFLPSSQQRHMHLSS